MTRLCRHYQTVSDAQERKKFLIDSLSILVLSLSLSLFLHLSQIETEEAARSSPPTGFPHLLTHSISSLKELKPLFDALLHQNRSIASNHHHHHSKLTATAASILGHSGQLEARLTAVETLLLCDFVEPFSS